MKIIELIKYNQSALERTKSIIESLIIYEKRFNNTILQPSDLTPVFNYLTKYQMTQGPQQLLRLFKISRHMVLSYLAGTRVDWESGTRIKTDREGLPSWLGKLKDREVLMNPKSVRFTLTVLYSSRWLKFDGKVDLSTITDSEWVETPPEFASWLYSPTNQLNAIPSWYKPYPVVFYSSTKAGPNGPALMSAYNDLLSLPDDYRDNLISFGKLLKEPEGPPSIPDFSNMTMETMDLSALLNIGKEVASADPVLDFLGEKRLLLGDLKLKRGRLRKLEVVVDKEGKRRAVAIVDYWLQCIMKSLHESLNGILTKIPDDCTFNQENFLHMLSFHGTETFYSIDLKSATELMPVSIQAEVLEWITNRPGIGRL